MARRLNGNEAPLYRAVGQAIQAARQERDIPQHALAKRMGISQSTLSHIELGDHRVALSTLLVIARLLDVPLVSLLPDECHGGRSREATDLYIKLAKIKAICNDIPKKART